MATDFVTLTQTIKVLTHVSVFRPVTYLWLYFVDSMGTFPYLHHESRSDENPTANHKIHPLSNLKSSWNLGGLKKCSSHSDGTASREAIQRSAVISADSSTNPLLLRQGPRVVHRIVLDLAAVSLPWVIFSLFHALTLPPAAKEAETGSQLTWGPDDERTHTSELGGTSLQNVWTRSILGH